MTAATTSTTSMSFHNSKAVMDSLPDAFERLTTEHVQTMLLTPPPSRSESISPNSEYSSHHRYELDEHHTLGIYDDITGSISASSLRTYFSDSIWTGANRYETIKVVQTTSTGVVLHARHCITATDVAIKVIRKNSRSSGLADRIALSFENEVAIHKTVNGHPHVVHLYTAFEDYDAFYLVMEYCETDLLDFIVERRDSGDCCRNEAVLNEHEVATYLGQVARALVYLHSKKIVHIDVKPENILMSRSKKGNIVCKLCDFGGSRFTGEDAGDDIRKGHLAGTLLYSAPEILTARNSDCASAASDAWSLGVTMYTAITGNVPYGSNTKERCHIHEIVSDILDEIMCGCSVEVPTNSSSELIEIMCSLLMPGPYDRGQLPTILRHSFWNSSGEK